MNIGEKVRMYLKEHKIKQSFLANKLGISRQNLNSLLKGNMRGNNLHKIANALGVSVTELIENRPPPNFSDLKGWVKLPVIGKVPAGVPIEAIEEHAGEVVVPPGQAKPGCFALKVAGDSMSPRILDNDVVVVAPCPDPRNGQIVVTRVNCDGEVTLKRFQRDGDVVALVPENPNYQTRILTPESDIKILGRVVGLYRGF